MGFRSGVKEFIKKGLGAFGYDLIPKGYSYDWQRADFVPEARDVGLPAGAEEYLTPDNPVLSDLHERYQTVDYPQSEVFLWTESRLKPEDILYFRGHNAFVFQKGGCNRNLFGSLLAYYYIKSIDHFNLLDLLVEDTSFGVITYKIDNKIVSRDLIDSILEIYFLQNQIGILEKKNISVLDIGAGYGRLAYRMVKAVPDLVHYYCTDAIPVSSFISDYYLKFREIHHKSEMLPLDLINAELKPGEIDLALNIHSFSECSIAAIDWWLKILSKKEIPYLMIIPNTRLDLLTNDRKDFKPLLDNAGYEMIAREPKFKDPVVQKYALNPDYYYLFKLK